MICTRYQLSLELSNKEKDVGVARSTRGEVRSSYRILIGKLGRKRPQGTLGVIS
jgi:hypothetical protein